MSIVYSALKAFNFDDRLQSIKSDSPLAPVHVRLKPLNACNHKCWFCAYRNDQLDLGASMRIADRIPEAKMYELLDDFSKMGVRAVTLSGGGEPLLYPGIENVIQRLGESGIKVGCLTNGSMLRGRVADAAAKYCTWIRVSMDAWDSESYSKSRGVNKDEFEKVFSNIKQFIARKSQCDLGISFIVTKENAPHIFEFVTRAIDAGVRSVKCSGCVVSNDGKENADYHNGIFPLVRQQIEKCLTLRSETFDFLDHYHEQLQSFSKAYTSCPSLSLLTVIGADCKVYTCQDKAYTDSGLLGSIKDQSFSKLWFSKEAIEQRSRLNPAASCLHHCVSHKKNVLLSEYLDLNPAHADFI